MPTVNAYSKRVRIDAGRAARCGGTPLAARHIRVEVPNLMQPRLGHVLQRRGMRQRLGALGRHLDVPEDVRDGGDLQAKLGAKSKVEVVRRGLRLLRDVTERESLRQLYRSASQATRASVRAELAELDHLSGEGLKES